MKAALSGMCIVALATAVGVGARTEQPQSSTRDKRKMAQATTSQTSTATKAVDQYFEAWNERDAKARLKAIEAAFTADAVYSDPSTDVKGHQAVSEMMGAAQARILEQHRSFSFVRTSRIEEHHRRIRFNWALKDPDGKTALSGVDFGEVDGSGRLRLIAGFFGESPAGS